jgi:hypothetical protein
MTKPRLTEAVMYGLTHLFRGCDVACFLKHSLALPPGDRDAHNKAINWISAMQAYRDSRRPLPNPLGLEPGD